MDKYFDDYVDVETIREDIYDILHERASDAYEEYNRVNKFCLLYTSPSPRDQRGSRMPSSA